ncbi:hypothetical protein DFJ58DRAFT_795302 [Suillus subalutaceus]|uniref:uncharacterized protein n=1 Tax=Suillus subalutaceus TaxID=48586 RepID=UPI001B86CCCD|nr:uncharacterized protein DFJ58DRAFT_795302 [Suillus subalutaceus]KAG1849143.1 hypothetical protein DFJ58DRAFT_795302 [Suillus subalutaceus]
MRTANTTKALSTPAFSLCVLCILSSMLVSLCKRPSTNSRVLDVNDCPPHNLVHDISSYPLFYYGTIMPLAPARFESATYLHCSILKHYETCQSNVSMQACMHSSLAHDPPWFLYPDDDYHKAVSALPAIALRA